MATKEEKIQAFKDLVGDGDLADTILRAAEGTEKEALAKGTAHKEKTEKGAKGVLLHRKVEEIYENGQSAPVQTERVSSPAPARVAAKPKPVVQPAQLEENPEEDMGDEMDAEYVGEDGEELQEDVAGDPNAAPVDENGNPVEVDENGNPVEAAPAEGEMPEVVGNMSIEEFAGLLADALAAALEPYLRKLKEVSDTVSDVQDEVVKRTKEFEGGSEQVVALKARLDKTERALQVAARTLKNASDRIAELESDVPSGARGYVASQERETIVTDERRIKESQPTPDPIGDFATNFVLGGRPQ